MFFDSHENSKRLVAEAERIRQEIGSSRTDTMLRLFDYLLEHSVAGHAPKELEIYHAVFAKGGASDASQDSTVRVYIHKLRKKLDEYYTDRPGPRIVIPKGEYRLTLIAAPGAAEGEPARPIATTIGNSLRKHKALTLIVMLFAVLNIAFWALMSWAYPSQPLPPAANSFFWRPLYQDGVASRPSLIVVADYYLIGEAVDDREVTHFIRDFSINSREDLEQYLMNHPQDFGHYIDINLSYLPSSTAVALDDIVPIVKAADRKKTRPSGSIIMTHLNPDILRKSNIVYVGFLSGLGMLRDPLFQASGFSIGESFDELIDRKTGKKYLADWGMFEGDSTPINDFGYIASMPGPAGNHILIVSGTRDAAVMQMAELVSDPEQLAALSKRVKGSDSFEALYHVRSIGNMNLDSSLLIARPLQTRGIWNGGKPNQLFPDTNPQSSRLNERRIEN
ncbi:helix-turn-helix domain-containing protein [Sphingobium cloacae]|uniref:helix-turn-helix domain-containing protein n=1 Tax=Sphingobium cloacae TaxID=120107 RepID=UPI000AE5B64D|nr:helix-turn-helix domain-containing protein [Sphingobium cloacae]